MSQITPKGTPNYPFLAPRSQRSLLPSEIMKRWILLLSLVGICGCAHEYVMKLSNGEQLLTPHKPKLKGTYFIYKGARGQEHMVPQSRVEQIEPASVAAKENKFTPSNPKPKHWWQF